MPGLMVMCVGQGQMLSFARRVGLPNCWICVWGSVVLYCTLALHESAAIEQYLTEEDRCCPGFGNLFAYGFSSYFGVMVLSAPLLSDSTK